jgi:hypothetical protein
MPIVLKSGSLNLLEPSGSVKACSGTALPLPHHNEPNLTGGILMYFCHHIVMIWRSEFEQHQTNVVALFINYISFKFRSTESKSTVTNTVKVNMLLKGNLNNSSCSYYYGLTG